MTKLCTFLVVVSLSTNKVVIFGEFSSGKRTNSWSKDVERNCKEYQCIINHYNQPMHPKFSPKVVQINNRYLMRMMKLELHKLEQKSIELLRYTFFLWWFFNEGSKVGWLLICWAKIAVTLKPGIWSWQWFFIGTVTQVSKNNASEKKGKISDIMWSWVTSSVKNHHQI